MNAERETRKPLRNGLIFAAVNLVGAVIYLLLSSRIHAFRESEGRDYYDFGDSLDYLWTALPVVLLFFLTDFIYSIYAVAVLIRRRNTTPIKFCGIVLALWIATLNIDIYNGWVPKGTMGWRDVFPMNLVKLFHIDPENK